MMHLLLGAVVSLSALLSVAGAAGLIRPPGDRTPRRPVVLVIAWACAAAMVVLALAFPWWTAELR